MAANNKGAKNTKKWSSVEENDLMFALHEACDFRPTGDGATAFLSSASNVNRRTEGVRFVGFGFFVSCWLCCACCARRSTPHDAQGCIGGRSPPARTTGWRTHAMRHAAQPPAQPPPPSQTPRGHSMRSNMRSYTPGRVMPRPAPRCRWAGP